MKLDVVKYGHPVLRQKGALQVISQTHAVGKLNFRIEPRKTPMS